MTGPDVASALLECEHRHEYVRHGWLPLRREGDVVVVGAAQPLARSQRARVERLIGSPIKVEPMLQSRIVGAVMAQFGADFAFEASEGLAQRDQQLSAKTVLSRTQQVFSAVVLILLVAAGILWPLQTLITAIAASSIVFLASTVFKFSIAMFGSRFDLAERIAADDLRALEDDELPIYTVLVPVFREARIVGRLVENLGRLDYPAERLEVLILVEEEDDETRDAIALSNPPDNFVVVTIPKGTPQTKPRACNVGLLVARGEFLVIYDAEDAPEPDQLKKTVVAFRRSTPETVVMQAALNYFNARENVLTRMFALEYSYWFDYMLPGLDVRDLPIPLGGTSNHFRTAALRELGGWDPYNVTEDADLGIRASALGYRVGVVDSTTMEEATSRIGIFIGQRSRWIKGYMQTALVHARRPVRLLRNIGWRRFGAFALLIGGTPITFLGVIPFTVILIASFLVPLAELSAVFPPLVLWLCLLNFVAGNALMVYLNMMGPYKRGAFRLVAWALLNPIYWLLHSIASYKALWQLITKPHYWQKTEHGLSEWVPEADAEGIARTGSAP